MDKRIANNITVHIASHLKHHLDVTARARFNYHQMGRPHTSYYIIFIAQEWDGVTRAWGILNNHFRQTYLPESDRSRP